LESISADWKEYGMEFGDGLNGKDNESLNGKEGRGYQYNNLKFYIGELKQVRNHHCDVDNDIRKVWRPSAKHNLI